jgi:hypothetical protein
MSSHRITVPAEVLNRRWEERVWSPIMQRWEEGGRLRAPRPDVRRLESRTWGHRYTLPLLEDDIQGETGMELLTGEEDWVPQDWEISVDASLDHIEQRLHQLEQQPPDPRTDIAAAVDRILGGN